MKTIVIYQSSTGFTRQYAEWIAESLGCEAIDVKHAPEKSVGEAELVIFGGWIMGNMVSGLEKIRKWNPKNLVVFAVGATPGNIVDVESMQKENHLEGIPFFYMEGGFRFEKLNFLVKGMLKNLKKATAKKEEKTAQEQFMAEYLGTSFDHADQKNIESLVMYVKERSSVE
ncbi:MAG: flavodoxin domain-containing protein [Lachnospiraceae bacterium]|nr:flavodoxin domain-containing protein [Lachnospiraceae bacterium]